MRHEVGTIMAMWIVCLLVLARTTIAAVDNEAAPEQRSRRLGAPQEDVGGKWIPDYNGQPGKSSKVVGGNIAASNSYEYFVLYKDPLVCGGALIAPDVFVTAAHCLNGSTKARVGAQMQNENADTQADVIDVALEIPHPLYDDALFPNDIMLVILSDHSTKTPIVLNTDSSIPHTDDPLTVVGLGYTKNTGKELADKLQEGNVNVVDNFDCSTRLHEDIAMDNLCALGNGVDACGGDSGSPLVKTAGKGDTLVGIVSWGKGCALDEYPGVYARISHFYDWIVSTTCLHSTAPPGYFNCAQVKKAATASSTTASLDFLGWNPSQLTDGIKLKKCQGDCDDDNDCEGDLVCFKRTDWNPVPGCDEGPGSRGVADYCVEP